MQKALQRIFSLFTKTNPPRKLYGHKSGGQSLVEVAIAFPVLIILFSGVIEFGFILNYYLSLLDATRESARLYSGADPFCNAISPSCPVVNPTTDNQDFYYQAAVLVRRTLDPSYIPLTDSFEPGYKGRRIPLDPAIDDVIVSVYSAKGSTVTLTRDAGVYHLFPPGSASGHYPSIFTVTDITNTRVSGAPNAGILVVEVHYNYHHVLGLPWMTAVISNPLHLRAYTVMPIRAAEPP